LHCRRLFPQVVSSSWLEFENENIIPALPTRHTDVLCGSRAHIDGHGIQCGSVILGPDESSIVVELGNKSTAKASVQLY
jgi:hypothetical protein